MKKAIAKIFDYDTELIEIKIKEIIENYPKDKNKIIEAYGKVSGSFNTNSMTLFSGTKNSYIEQYYAIPKYCFCDRCCFIVKENGCLYLGDYNASGTEKWGALSKAYNDYWKYIGCVQIPHHGSRHNYNNEMAKLNAINVISAGYKNRYRHPHSSVLKDLMLNDCTVHIVTENVGSQVDLMVNCF